MFVLKVRDATIHLKSVAFSPDGTRLAVAGGRGEFSVWDVVSRECVLPPYTTWENLAAFFGEGGRELFLLNRYLINPTRGLRAFLLGGRISGPPGQMDLRIRSRLSPNGEEWCPFREVAHLHLVTPSPDGRRAFCCLHRNRPGLTCHSLATFDCLWSAPFGEQGGELEVPPACMSCSLDGKRLACGHPNGLLSVLDAETGAWVRHTANAGRPGVKALAISPNGDALAWCAAANLYFERWPDGPTVHHRLGKTHFLNVAWHPSGAFFATGNGDGKVDTWDGVTGQRRASFDWGVGKLTGIAFDPTGYLGAACSDTGHAVVWDVDH